MISSDRFRINSRLSALAWPLRLVGLVWLFWLTFDLSAATKFEANALNTYLPHLTFAGPPLQLKDLGYIYSDYQDFGIDQAIQRFSTGDFARVALNDLENYGSRTGSHWFAATITNKTAFNESLFLYFENTNPDQVDLWITQPRASESSLTYRQSGHAIPPGERDLFINNSAIRVYLEPGGETILIWRVQNIGPTILSMFIIKATDLFERLQTYAMTLMGLIGGLISLMVFSVFLFNAVRDRTYLFFIAQLAGFSLYLFFLHGYGNLFFWPNQQAFDKEVNDLALIAALLATLQLLRLFLHTKQQDPIFHRILGVCIWVMPVFILLVSLDYQLGILLLLIATIMIIALANIAAIRALVRGEKGIVVSLVGWVILSISSCLVIFINEGLQIAGPAMAILFRAEHWGIFIGSILFMFALTRRIQYLRRDKEKAEHKNRLKQDFIANISHEMRTPLNGIIGFAESVALSDHLGEIKFYNKRIISESERLLFQINQLLDLAKIEAGRFELESRPFSLPQSLAYLHSAYSMKANAKGLDFNLSMDSACPLALTGDRLRVEQILRNLIDNAIKFTDSGSVGVAVRVHRQDTQQAVLVFDISDTGIGIDQNKLDLIMEDFVQADSSITRRFGGTGLGTSIARRLVEAMDGHIEVKSSPGMGTNFRVYLPFGIAPAISESSTILVPAPEKPAMTNPETIVAEPQISANYPSDKKFRILIVDDLDTNRQVLRIHLCKLNILTDEAEDGETALSMLVTTHYDLVLMDVFMPGMSGHDATRAIRAMPGMEKIPVIAVTASGFQEDLDAAADAGMNEVLLKPIKRDVLVNLISRYLHI